MRPFEIPITCPTCGAHGIFMSDRFTMRAHHAGVDDSDRIPIWDKRACQGIRVHPDVLFQQLMERDIYRKTVK